MNDMQMDAAGYSIKKRRSRKVKTLKELNDDAIKDALNSVSGHRRKAAERLGIHESTLYRWLANCE
jgi:transcriptional regulator with PAS, ATPase and Fis domain